MRKIKETGLMRWGLLVVFLLALPVFCRAQDKIVAIVNNEVITQRDLDEFVNFTRLQLARDSSEAAVESRIEGMRKGLLDKLIEDRLILQEAKKQDIKVDEGRIKARIAEVKKRYSSDADFQGELARQGLVQADLEKKMREQMCMFMMVQKNVQEKVYVRPEEVTGFYNSNLKEFMVPEERSFDIVILDAKREDTAQDFLANLKAGTSMEELSGKYSFSQDKIKARREGELRKDIEEAVYQLKPGEFSRPFKLNEKYYIFKLAQIASPRQLPLSEVQEKIQAHLFEKKMQEQLANWLDELRARSYVKVMS